METVPIVESRVAPSEADPKISVPIDTTVSTIIGTEVVKSPGQKRRRGRSQDARVSQAIKILYAAPSVPIAPIVRASPTVSTVAATPKGQTHPVVIDLKACTSDLVDEDGFTRVVNIKSPTHKKSPKLAVQPELQNFVTMNKVGLMGVLETNVKAHNALGYFNCVLDIDEISGGREHWTPDMQIFKDCVTDLGLGHVRTLGELFTWTNKRSQVPILKRLDRMIVNALWFNTFTEGNVVVHHRGIMDHNPLLYEEPLQFNFKLKNAKKALRAFNKEHGNLHNIVHTVRMQLAEVQNALVLNKILELMHQEQALVEKLNVAILQEEHFLLQNLENETMDLVYGQHECANVVVSYYQVLLANIGTQGSIDLSSVTCNTVTIEQSSSLVAPVTDSLILKTLKSIKRNKAPGPDGVNVEFFIATWEITGLLPDIGNIAKSAFIPGRSISDNILLAQELFHGYDRETGASRCALKIDLHKTFDTLKWDFILVVLHKIRVPDVMISWIKSCVYSPRLNPRVHHIATLLARLLEDTNLPTIHSSGTDHILWDGLDASKIKTWHIWEAIRDLRPVVPCKWILLRVFDTIGISTMLESWNHFLVSLIDLEDKPKGTIALCYAQVFCYYLWRDRNARAHDRGVFGPSKLLQGIVLDIKDKLAFAKDVFINQERKLGARRRSDTVLVSTINDADQGSVDVAFRTPLEPYEKSKFLGSRGSIVARMKLKGIDKRAPPGVEPAT
ncbi:hypothetical protein AgCh_033905 [Apium graveolens]